MNAAHTGKQIADRRKAKGLTQKALAEALHVTDKAVSKWERGINFPDLGLIENLAKELDTTPAVLLCLEEAHNEDAVNSVIQLSAQQAEEARRDICRAEWIAMALAVMLMLVSVLYGRSVRSTQYAYYILYTAAIATAFVGRYILWKYRLLLEMEPFDLIPAAMTVFPVLGIFIVQWFTGTNPPAMWMCVLILTAALGVQLLFCRLLVQPLAKGIPMLLAVSYALRHLVNGRINAGNWLPAVGCIVMYFAYCSWVRKKKRPENNKIPS